jgi:serine/threonine protein phosphatase PrpC
MPGFIKSLASSLSSVNPFANESGKKAAPSLAQSLAVQSLGSAGRISTGIQLKVPYVSDHLKVSAIQKSLLRNFERTLRDFGKRQSEIEALVKSVYSNTQATPLKFLHHAHSAQGRRPSMEDQHFARDANGTFIFGVCDGHADNRQISSLCATRIEAEFENEVKATGNVTEAAQKVINRIQQQVVANGLPGGSTVCFGFIKDNILTSVNLGDSEIRIYRKKGSNIECIPASRVLDWRSPKEAERAAEALGCPEIAQQWPNRPKQEAKLLRAPLKFGINLSRAVGDAAYQLWIKNTSVQLITQKVKVLQVKLEKGDLLVAACDGLWDVEGQKLPSSILARNWNQSPESLAEKIVTYALDTCRSTDNVSAVVVKC